MERLDAIVAGVGAIILAVAIVGAGLHGATASADYALLYESHTDTSTPQGTGAGTLASFPIPVLGNVSSVTVEVTFSATFPTGGSAHVDLVSPNGTSTGADGAIAPGGASFVVKVTVMVNETPQNATVRATSASDAARQLKNAPSNSTWTATARFAPTGPAPANGVSIQAAATVTTWTGRVSSSALPSK